MDDQKSKATRLILTEDGSHSIFSEAFGCSYHSLKGAIQESQFIFIQQGLDFFATKTNNPNIRILEFGFGTGLNALLSYLYIQNKSFSLEYDSIEAYPLVADTISNLNFCKTLGIEDNLLLNMHHSVKPGRQFSNFKLNLMITKFEDFIPERTYDIIYFDVFGPDDQPQFWQRPFLDILERLTKAESILVSYSVKGSFRRALKELGFSLEKLPGPPGKREILRATKI